MHYSSAELESLIAAANKVCEDESRKSPALVVLKNESGYRASDNRLSLEAKIGAPGRI